MYMEINPINTIPIEILSIILSYTYPSINRFVCKLWKQASTIKNEDLCAIAARSGWLNVLKWARENDCPWNLETFEATVYRNDRNMFDWITEHDCPSGMGFPDYKIYEHIVKLGHIDALAYIGRNLHHPMMTDLIPVKLAAKHVQIDMLEWMLNNQYAVCNTRIGRIAAKKGHTVLLQWLHDSELDMDPTNVLRIAATNGHLNILKWMKENGYYWNNSISEYAASNGHTHILEWLNHSDQTTK